MCQTEPDVVIVGAGIAGGALGAVLARVGFEVVLLERENSYPDRVRGEFMAPWGVTELAKLELLFASSRKHSASGWPRAHGGRERNHFSSADSLRRIC